jgi:uncharacterized Fe-S cluster protein YjdI
VTAVEKKYTGAAITVAFNPEICIHAAECVRGLPQVFNRQARPWVSPDAAPADEIAEVVLRCPTGALHFERHDGGASEPVPVMTTITPRLNGPLFLRGDIEIRNAAGELVRKDTRVALCRCGQSRNKPFCDGTHREIGFEAE